MYVFINHNPRIMDAKVLLTIVRPDCAMRCIDWWQFRVIILYRFIILFFILMFVILDE